MSFAWYFWHKLVQLFVARRYICVQWPFDRIVRSVLLLQLLRGAPLHLLHCGFHGRVCCAMQLVGLPFVWPNYS